MRTQRTPFKPPRASAGAMAAGAFHFLGEAALRHPTSSQRDGTVLLGQLEHVSFPATAYRADEPLRLFQTNTPTPPKIKAPKNQ